MTQARIRKMMSSHLKNDKMFGEKFLSSIKFSNITIEALQSLELDESLQVEFDIIHNRYSKLRNHIVSIESKRSGHDRMIIHNATNLSISVSATFTKLSKTIVKCEFNLSTAYDGDSAILSNIEELNTRSQMRRPLDKFVEDFSYKKSQMIKEFANHFNCSDDEIELHLDNYVRVVNVSRSFPRCYNLTDLAKFYLTELRRYVEVDAKDLELDETKSFHVDLTKYSKITYNRNAYTRRALQEDKYIYRQLNNSQLFQIKIVKHGVTFLAYSSNHEDAVNIRNEALQFYVENGRLPSRKEINYVLESNTLDDRNYFYVKELDLWCGKVRKKGKIITISHKDETMIKASLEAINSMMIDGRRVEDILKLYEKSELSLVKNIAISKNISFAIDRLKYHVQINRNGRLKGVYASTYEEALKIRLYLIDYFEKNGHHPDNNKMIRV